jgi:hypothetical protein
MSEGVVECKTEALISRDQHPRHPNQAHDRARSLTGHTRVVSKLRGACDFTEARAAGGVAIIRTTNWRTHPRRTPAQAEDIFPQGDEYDGMLSGEGHVQPGIHSKQSKERRHGRTQSPGGGGESTIEASRLVPQERRPHRTALERPHRRAFSRTPVMSEIPVWLPADGSDIRRPSHP